MHQQGSETIAPNIVSPSANVRVSSIARMKFPGSVMNTIGMATRPSPVQSVRLRRSREERARGADDANGGRGAGGPGRAGGAAAGPAEGRGAGRLASLTARDGPAGRGKLNLLLFARPARTLAEVARLVRLSEVRSRDTVAVARSLVGKLLVTRSADGRRLARRIVEVEAYDGPLDLACHASRGRTPRTETMFSAGGVWYVYFIYGMHEMLNLVTGPRGYPAAVLIRAVEGVKGPGRVTRAFGIDRRFNGRPATRATGLWLEDDGLGPDAGLVRATPRIGVDYSGPEWSAKPWRFVAEEPVSAPRASGRSDPPKARAPASPPASRLPSPRPRATRR